MAGLTDDSNGLKLGESHAILRYLATQYKPSLVSRQPRRQRGIDGMDNFTNYVFLKGGRNGSINCVIGELLGLDAWRLPGHCLCAAASNS